MSNEHRIRELARRALTEKKLPARDPDRTWGRPGGGAPCTICGELVTRDQLEYEIQFAHDGDNPGLDNHHLHRRCFASWEVERTKVDQ